MLSKNRNNVNSKFSIQHYLNNDCTGIYGAQGFHKIGHSLRKREENKYFMTDFAFLKVRGSITRVAIQWGTKGQTTDMYVML